MEDYVITDGSSFVRQNFNGKYGFTTNLSLADMYSCKTANQVLKHCLSKSKSIGFGVARISDGNIESIAIPSDRKQKSVAKQQKSKQELAEKRESTCSVKNEYRHIMESSARIWYDRINSVEGLYDDAISRIDELSQIHSQLEKIQCDLLHYIEFNKLNCCNGYKAYAVLHEILNMRREVKDELEVLGYITGDFDKETQTKVKHICSSIMGKDNRSYAPRELDELFSDGISSKQIQDKIKLIQSNVCYALQGSTETV